MGKAITDILDPMTGIGLESLSPLNVNPFDPLNIAESTAKGLGKETFNFYDPLDLGQRAGVSPDLLRAVGTIAGAYTGNPYLAIGANTAAGSMEGGIRGANIGGFSTLAGNYLGGVGVPGEIGKTSVVGKALNAAAPNVGEIVVTGYRPNLIQQGLTMAGQIAPDAATTLGAKQAGMIDQGRVGQKPPQQDGNQFGDTTRAIANEALSFLTAPNAPGGSMATSGPSPSPFSGPGSGAAPPAGLSIKGSSAPDIYPWKRAA